MSETAAAECRNLKEEDIPHAGELCARVFLHARGYVSIYGGTDEWRYNELLYLFTNNIRMIYLTQPDSLYGAFDENSSKLICFFMLTRSDLPSASLWQKISAGLLSIPFRCGLNVFSRLITASNHFEQLYNQAVSQTHYELQRMVVDPQCQGKGIGTKWLRKGLLKADMDNLPIVLGTQEEINVRFYSKLGFEIFLQEKFTPSGELEHEYDNWILVRQPKSNINSM